MISRFKAFVVATVLCAVICNTSSTAWAESEGAIKHSPLVFSLFSPRYLAFTYIEEPLVSSSPMRIVRLWKRADGLGEGEELVSIPSRKKEEIALSVTRWIMSTSRWTEIAGYLETNRVWVSAGGDKQSAPEMDYMDGICVSFFRYQAKSVSTSQDVKRRIQPDKLDGTSSQSVIKLVYAAIPEESERLPNGVLVADWRYFDEKGTLVRIKTSVAN